MMSTTVHGNGIGKPRGFSLNAMNTASTLFLVATLMGLFTPMTVYGDPSQPKATSKVPSITGDPGLASTSSQVNTRPIFTNTSNQTIKGITLAVFYKRPEGYMPGKEGCANPVLSYTPSISVAKPTQSCPWFTCNYVSWDKFGKGACSLVGLSQAQLKQANGSTKLPSSVAWSKFNPLPSKASGADTYMLLMFPNASLAPQGKFTLNGCIYYDNWPHFSDQKAIDAMAVYSGKNMLQFWGKQPTGLNPKTLFTANGQKQSPAAMPLHWTPS
jgi:hypothetical protein